MLRLKFAFGILPQKTVLRPIPKPPLKGEAAVGRVPEGTRSGPLGLATEGGGGVLLAFRLFTASSKVCFLNRMFVK